MDTKKVSNGERFVTFSEENHLYLLDGKEKMVSGTTFIKSFFPKFEKDKIAFFYGRKHGMTKDQVLAMWSEKGTRAAEYGTNCHYYAECIIKGELPPKPKNEKEEKTFQRIRMAVDGMSNHIEFIDSEMIVFSPKHMIAGTIDLLARSKNTNIVYVLDWKTNEKVEFENRYGEYAYFPIEDLPNCNGMHYTLQLNLYRYLLINEGYVDADTQMALIHINNEKFEWISVDIMEDEIKKMLEAYSER